MRYEKQKIMKVLQENIDKNSINEVNTMKCPMCGLDESNQITVESDGMKKPKCNGCGTIFFDSSIR